ncbi:MAG: Hsp20/alpha crystallin family protein, partial [Patescibacteria group bacterium]|nr:Hsp20/alpha crystallin family protein [Patescibacteria group bacterium]
LPILEKTGESIADEEEGQLTVDVCETPTEFIIESTIAGVDPSDIDLDVSGESVTIRGERHKKKASEDGNYLFQECFWGKFSRSIILPQEIDADKAESSLKNGVLTIRLPKLHREKNKKVHIRVD